MKRCYILSFIMLCILQAGCKKQTTRNVDIHVIDFEQCFDTEQQMFLSEIADSIEYIELKTPDDVIITRIWDIKQIDDYLIIHSRWDVYLFHRNGQFIRQIGSHGQGPGEYIVPGTIEIDRKKKEIVIADTQKLLFYDLDGNFLRSR
ncbi:MAG: 6-bladed beta-propeller, partial [Dysgonamonadaceae bacterium]|nr:6-bladed beta-propeller [Dysgonamonadaceae bacterium]